MRSAKKRNGLLAGCLLAVVLAAMASTASAKTYHPTRTDDPAPNGCKKRDCSLREAVIAANASGGGTIVLRRGKLYVLTRKGAGENAALTGDLDLHAIIGVRTKGKNGPMATIDARGIDRIFEGRPTDFGGPQIIPPNTPTLNRVILRGGHARATAGDPGNGGAILGNPEVIDSRLIKNTADARGGAVYFNRGPGTVSRSTLKGNTAAGDGGALYFLQACNGPEGHLWFGGSHATKNTAGGSGGGIFSYCNAEIHRSYVGGNSAKGPGGGIFSPGRTIPPDATASDPSDWGSSVSMWQSTVTGNRSRSYGGGTALDAGSGGSISLSTISGNTALASGGGIGVNAPTAKPTISVGIQTSTIANNKAGRDAGGVGTVDASVGFGSHASISLDHATVARNQANTELESGVQRSGIGGGIYTEDNDSFTVRNTIVALNTVATQHKPQASDCAVGFGNPFVSLGHNLIGNGTGCEGLGAAGDLFGGQLKLGKLADNGGPTKTIALQKGSRAIDHADKTVPQLTGNNDQRGVRRGKKPDIGAYERKARKP